MPALFPILAIAGIFVFITSHAATHPNSQNHAAHPTSNSQRESSK